MYGNDNRYSVMAETLSLEEIYLLISNSKNRYHVFFGIIDQTNFISQTISGNIIDFSKCVLYIHVKCVSFKRYTVLRLLLSL